MSCEWRWIFLLHAVNQDAPELEADDVTEVIVKKGDESWWNGPGWYWWEAPYGEERSCGPFPTKDAAIRNARDYLPEIKVTEL